MCQLEPVDIMESIDMLILTLKHFTMCSKPFARSRAGHVVLEHALDYLLVKKSLVSHYRRFRTSPIFKHTNSEKLKLKLRFSQPQHLGKLFS